MKDERQVPGLAVRDRAVEILLRVEGGRHADEQIERAADAFPDPRDAALLRECVLGTLRQRLRLDAALQPCSRRPLGELDPVVREALRLAAFQMYFLERVPASAAVDTAVGLVSRRAGPGAGAFTNAVLRALGRAHPQGLPVPEDPGVRHSHPAWLAERIAQELARDGATGELEAALAANNEPALLGVREVAASPSSPAAAEGPGGSTPSPWVPGAWRTASVSAALLEDLRAGRVYVQDEAAMLAGALCVADSPGAVVLDLCAAPGGKSLSAWLAGARVAACDRDARRLERLRGNLARFARAAGLAGEDSRGSSGSAACVRADALAPPFPRASADLVIVDAPCSGTGVIRRHPEIRWRLTPEAIARHAERQRRLLRAAAELVRPGGALVYSVCSVLREEGEDVVASLTSVDPRFRLEDARRWLPSEAHSLVTPEGILRAWPHRHGLDGHIAARLENR